jgi:hypothetical protein
LEYDFLKERFSIDIVSLWEMHSMNNVFAHRAIISIEKDTNCPLIARKASISIDVSKNTGLFVRNYRSW